MARKIHTGNFQIMWRINPEARPAHCEWKILDSFHSRELRDQKFSRLGHTDTNLEFKKQTKNP